MEQPKVANAENGNRKPVAKTEHIERINEILELMNRFDSLGSEITERDVPLSIISD